MKDLQAAIERGDMDAFLAICTRAVEQGDATIVQRAISAMSRLPIGVAEPLKQRIRAAFPQLVSGRATFAVGDDPLGASNELNGFVLQTLAGDREGALAALAQHPGRGLAGGVELAAAIVRAVPDPATLPRARVVDRGEDVVISEPGSRGTIVAFCGLGDRIWLDLPAFDGWVAQAGYGAIYLRDRSRRLYTQGVPSLGDGPELLAQLRQWRDAEPGEFVFLGSSSGGYGALYWACALGVERTVMFSAPTSTQPAHLQAIGDDRCLMLQKLMMPEDGGPDLRARMLDTGHAGRVDLYYGADMAIDRRHAAHLDLGNVHHHPVADWSLHQVLLALVAAGRLPGILTGDDAGGR